MPALSQYSNVHDTAVALLRQKGYQVWTSAAGDTWYAERDGWDFAAFDPVGLLGVVAIFEAVAPADYREYWWRDEAAAGAASSLPTQPTRPYVPVYRRRR